MLFRLFPASGCGSGRRKQRTGDEEHRHGDDDRPVRLDEYAGENGLQHGKQGDDEYGPPVLPDDGWVYHHADGYEEDGPEKVLDP